MYEALDQETGATIAVKVLPIASQGGYGDEEAALKKMMREIHIMRELHHDNIVHFLSCDKASLLWAHRRNPHPRPLPLQTEEELHIFLEYVAGGSVASMVKQYGSLALPVVQRYTVQMFQGLAFLHEQQIAHRDIKAGPSASRLSHSR